MTIDMKYFNNYVGAKKLNKTYAGFSITGKIKSVIKEKLVLLTSGKMF